MKRVQYWTSHTWSLKYHVWNLMYVYSTWTSHSRSQQTLSKERLVFESGADTVENRTSKLYTGMKFKHLIQFQIFQPFDPSSTSPSIPAPRWLRISWPSSTIRPPTSRRLSRSWRRRSGSTSPYTCSFDRRAGGARGGVGSKQTLHCPFPAVSSLILQFTFHFEAFADISKTHWLIDLQNILNS